MAYHCYNVRIEKKKSKINSFFNKWPENVVLGFISSFFAHIHSYSCSPHWYWAHFSSRLNMYTFLSAICKWRRFCFCIDNLCVLWTQWDENRHTYSLLRDTFYRFEVERISYITLWLVAFSYFLTPFSCCSEGVKKRWKGDIKSLMSHNLVSSGYKYLHRTWVIQSRLQSHALILLNNFFPQLQKRETDKSL